MRYATYFCLWNVHELWLCLSQLTYYTCRTVCSLSFKSYAVAPLSLWHDQNSRSFSGKITILVCKFPCSHMNMGGGCMKSNYSKYLCECLYMAESQQKQGQIYMTQQMISNLSAFLQVGSLLFVLLLLKQAKTEFYTFETQQWKNWSTVPMCQFTYWLWELLWTVARTNGLSLPFCCISSRFNSVVTINSAFCL